MFQSWQRVQDCNFPPSILHVIFHYSFLHRWHLFCSSFAYAQSADWWHSPRPTYSTFF
jgi:hypothetical protein